MRYPALVVLSLVLCCGASLGPIMPAAAEQPTILQTFTSDLALRAAAVSPSGEKIAILDTAGLKVYNLKPSGKIGALTTHSLLLPNLARCVFSNNGKWIILASDDGKLWRVERSTWLVSSITSTDGHLVGDLALTENPAYAFAAYCDSNSGSVWRYANAKVPLTSVPALTNMAYGLWVVPSGDGRRIVAGGFGAPGSPNSGGLRCQDNPLVGTQQYWTKAGSSTYNAACIGPDPDHVLVAEANTHTLHMLKFADGSGCHGSHALGADPCGVAFTPDGYYAVVPDDDGCNVTVISGHDLRGILNGQQGLNPDNVRSAKVELARSPRGVTVHPTLPIAYVWGTTTKRIDVIKLAIPGIEHP